VAAVTPLQKKRQSYQESFSVRLDDRVELLTPKGANLMHLEDRGALMPFAPKVLCFLSELSQMLCTDPRAASLPDLFSFGFWCRRASLEIMRREFTELNQRLGRGLVFHIGPANVPVNFAYSLVVGLLAGNANIVRVPSADFVQVRIIAEALDALLGTPAHSDLREYIRLIRYDRNAQDITAFYSRNCNLRVIWGGDETINNIRSNKIPAHAFDITFANRYSICVIGAKRFMEERNHKSLAQGFYNDTFLFDQNACTAPHLVLWMGPPNIVEQARDIFWKELHTFAQSHYHLEPRAAVDKLAQALHFVATHEDSKIIRSKDNLITRISLDKLPKNIENWQGNCGFFFEFILEDLQELFPIISHRYQTLSYAGLEKNTLHEVVRSSGVLGIDRIVPIGRTLEFSLQWDGYDLIRTLSRVIKVV
jgi:hypothetical protein